MAMAGLSVEDRVTSYKKCWSWELDYHMKLCFATFSSKT